ncbi:MAG: hypothetical protein U0175_20295 [Caldilineaceae bacterium]
MTVNIKPQFVSDNATTSELEVFLLSYFGTARQLEQNRIEVGGQLIVEYYSSKNKKHSEREIKSIFMMNENDHKLLEELITKATEALSIEHGLTVGRSILFSPYEVNANYSFEKSFQILNVPNSAPKSDELLADHPFILEYSYFKSPNIAVDMQRRNKRFWELVLLLNTFLKGGVTYIRPTASKVWAIVPNEFSKFESKFLQLGYILPPLENEGIDFTRYDQNNRIQEMPISSYFSRNTQKIDEKLAIPDNISTLFSKFDALPASERDNFLRASYWKQVSSDSLYISQSNAYIALINAIESLIPNEKAQWCCITCHKEEKRGLTQLFHDFVETYAPLVEPHQRKRFYEIRSKYTHGKKLMQGDLEYMGMSFNSSKFEEFENFRVLAKLVQEAMINWLLAVETQ